jgi:PAS domain S-box-containing protein
MFLPLFHPHEIRRIGWIISGFFLAWMAALLCTQLLAPPGNAVYMFLHVNATRICLILDALIFSLAWHAFGTDRRTSTVVLALSFLCAGSFDFLYLTNLPGRPFMFAQGSVETSPYFWILARLSTALGVMLTLLIPAGQRLGRARSRMAFGLCCGAIVAVAALVLQGWLPAAAGCILFLHRATGSLTLTLALAASIVVWLRRADGQHSEPALGLDRVDRFAASLALLVSEAYFNFLQDETGALLGPVFKLFAGIYLYRAVLSGSINAPYTTLTALTEHLQQTSTALRRSELRLAGIIDNATDAIITVDEAGTIVLANPAAAAMFRITQAQMAGSAMQSLLPARLRPDYHAYVRNYAKVKFSHAKCNCEYDVAGLRSTGDEFPMEASISAMVEQDQRYTILILRDITERKRAQEALAHSNRELTRLSNALQTVREEERKNIARKLHDDLGQLLATICNDVAVLQQQVEDSSSLPRERLDNMGLLLSDSVASLRRIAADLSPLALEEGGLFFALQRLRKDFILRHRLRCELITEESELCMPVQYATNLYRVVEEALNNVARHANAREVVICVERRAGLLTLVIEDDGRGMDAADVGKVRTAGLLDMRARVKSMQGQMAVAGRPGQGTRIDITIPMETDK